MSAGRRHIYIPDDLWRRLQSEAGATGVHERGRAYSASEFVCNLLRDSLARQADVTPRQHSVESTRQLALQRTEHREHEDLQASRPFAPVTKEQQTRRGRTCKCGR